MQADLMHLSSNLCRSAAEKKDYVVGIPDRYSSHSEDLLVPVIPL